MQQEIKTINLLLPYKLGSVNCYLIETDTGYILIDTGCSNKRIDLEKELESTGCKPDNFKLIVLTHGDFDHTGNAAYLREKYGTKIAMHYDDSGMGERGNMSWNRKKPNINFKRIREIKSEIGVPLVLHGGSDIPDDMVRKAIEYGIRKINVGTNIKYSWSQAIKEAQKDGEKEPLILSAYAREKIKEVVKKKLRLFDSCNRL